MELIRVLNPDTKIELQNVIVGNTIGAILAFTSLLPFTFFCNSLFDLHPGSLLKETMLKTNQTKTVRKPEVDANRSNLNKNFSGLKTR